MLIYAHYFPALQTFFLKRVLMQALQVEKVIFVFLFEHFCTAQQYYVSSCLYEIK